MIKNPGECRTKACNRHAGQCVLIVTRVYDKPPYVNTPLQQNPRYDNTPSTCAAILPKEIGHVFTCVCLSVRECEITTPKQMNEF